jgi:hypothetical protein
MYSFSDLKRALKSPKLFLRELNRYYYTRGRKQEYNKKGNDIFEEDWDNLIILDACRFELFEEKKDFGKLEKRISRGSSTFEYMKGNFQDRDLLNTVYVTANPHFTHMKNELDTEIFEVEDVWGGEGWNDIEDTVMPEKVKEQALKSYEEFSDKRLVVHFMQPHYPFLSDNQNIPSGVSKIWHKVFQGDIDVDPEDAWDAYEDTFDRVWEQVEDLLEELDGKTVITADHGNVYGERVSPIPVKEWGHPIGIYDEKLVKVPWLVIEGDRRDITESQGSEGEDVDEEEIKEKLGALGYGQ